MKVLPTPFTRAMLGWISDANMSLSRWASIDELVDLNAMNINMSGVAFTTATPCCVTCAGSSGAARLTLFCT